MLYLANLVAFFITQSPVVELPVMPFTNVEELANLNGDINYGAKMGGSTAKFFRDSENPVYYKIFEHMASNEEDSMIQSQAEAIEKVKTENFAYFMESTAIDYVVARDCSLTRVGGMLDSKGYGIAMKKCKDLIGI